MLSPRRDLLVLSKRVSEDPKQLEHEVEVLDAILFEIETIHNVCLCSELLDVNNYKVIRKPFLIETKLKEPQLKPFQFLFNKN